MCLPICTAPCRDALVSPHPKRRAALARTAAGPKDNCAALEDDLHFAFQVGIARGAAGWVSSLHSR